jgi:hypothetical protein
VTNKLNLYYGARLEWQKLKGENASDTRIRPT